MKLPVINGTYIVSYNREKGGEIVDHISPDVDVALNRRSSRSRLNRKPDVSTQNFTHGLAAWGGRDLGMWLIVVGILISSTCMVSGLISRWSTSSARRLRASRWREVQAKAKRAENGLAELGGLQNSKVIFSGCTCGECFSCRAMERYSAGCNCGFCEGCQQKGNHPGGCMCLSCDTK